MKIRYTGKFQRNVFGVPMVNGDVREFTADEAALVLKLEDMERVEDTGETFNQANLDAAVENRRPFSIVGEAGKPIRIVTKPVTPTPTLEKPAPKAKRIAKTASRKKK